VNAGWSLLSSAIAFDVDQTLGAQGTFVSVWKWENGTWSVYLPGEQTPGAYASSKGFGVLAAINPGEGFWVNAKEASAITLNGMFEYGTLELSSGWNLVGLENGQAVSVAEMVEAHPAIISLWKWAKGTWEVYLPDEPSPGGYAQSKGFAPLDVVNPGEGIWVHMQ
jgi:hypothetical protein